MKLTRQAMAMVSAAALICVFDSAEAGSGTHKYYAKTGFYVGLTIPQNTFKTNFDGKIVQKGQDEVFLPKVGGKYGFGILLGSRYNLLESLGLDYSDVKEGATEISYIRSTHNASQQGNQGEAVFNMLSLDLKMFFLPKARFQPYIVAGLGYSWLSLKGASSATAFENSAAESEAKFSGLGFNGGLGLMFYFSPQVSVSGGFAWRVMYYGDVKNVDRFGNTTITSEDKLEGGGRTFDISMRFTF